jgi:phenylpyruvate tautomerase PptA (4-oxalocrotonate tautomerase family)
MAQIKVYGVAAALNPVKEKLSEVIHSCVVDALALPADKRFHRFFPMDPSDFFFPPGRSDRYTIVEVSLFEGRTVEAKKAFIRLIFERLGRELGIAANDVEITLTETPRHNWGLRGQPADEIALSYRVEV